MVDGPSSSPAAPRAAPVCRLDRPDPRARRVRPPPSGGQAHADRSAVVFLRSRSDVDVTEGGVRDRTRRGSGSGPQPPSTPVAGAVGRGIAPPGLVPDRSDTPCGRTDVRSTGREDRTPAGTTDHPDTSTMNDAAPDEQAPDGSTRPQRAIVSMIESYQRAFEGRPSPCRFFPSCSSYAHEAVVVHGTVRGGWLALRRLVRCRPLGPSGFDPVPEPAHSGSSPGSAEDAAETHSPVASMSSSHPPHPPTAPDEDH